MSPFWNLSETSRSLGGALLDILFPPRCPLCARGGDHPLLCPDCLASFRPVTGPHCPRCGTPFVTDEGGDHLCGHCLQDPPRFERGGSLYLFGGGVTEAIHQVKYGRKDRLGSVLGDLLAAHPLALLPYDAILAVPLHLRRLRERGFNQSQLLADRIGRRMARPVEPFLLARVRETASQTGMSRRARGENVRNAFALRKGARVEGRRFLLVDDVYTTGATVRECSRVLMKGGAASVSVLTLARVADY